MHAHARVSPKSPRGATFALTVLHGRIAQPWSTDHARHLCRAVLPLKSEHSIACTLAEGHDACHAHRPIESPPEGKAACALNTRPTLHTRTGPTCG